MGGGDAQCGSYQGICCFGFLHCQNHARDHHPHHPPWGCTEGVILRPYNVLNNSTGAVPAQGRSHSIHVCPMWAVSALDSGNSVGECPQWALCTWNSRLICICPRGTRTLVQLGCALFGRGVWGTRQWNSDNLCASSRQTHVRPDRLRIHYQ